MGALTTLAAVKLHPGMSDTSDEALLAQLINQASADIESRCNRTLTRETRTAEAYTGDGGKKLYLDLYPVTAVSSVTLDGVAVTDYILTGKSGLLTREAGWTRGLAITVTYTGGYQLEAVTGPPATARDLPFDLEGAAITLVSYLKGIDGNEPLKREKVGPLESEFAPEPPAIEAVIGRYRRIPV